MPSLRHTSFFNRDAVVLESFGIDGRTPHHPGVRIEANTSEWLFSCSTAKTTSEHQEKQAAE